MRPSARLQTWLACLSVSALLMGCGSNDAPSTDPTPSPDVSEPEADVADDPDSGLVDTSSATPDVLGPTEDTPEPVADTPDPAPDVVTPEPDGALTDTSEPDPDDVMPDAEATEDDTVTEDAPGADACQGEGCSDPCGDGVCASNEHTFNCPEDCDPTPGTWCENPNDYQGMGPIWGCNEECILWEDMLAMSENGVCDEPFNCAAMSWDSGDCAPVCEDDELLSCDGTECVAVSVLENDTCDSELDCEGYGWDGGNCPHCGDGDCAINEHTFNCPEDCDPTPGAWCENPNDYQGMGPIWGCNEECVLWEDMLAMSENGVCDEAFNCEAMSWDSGDCEP